jgi:heme-degrading monooxygenase HmoA
MLTPSGNLKGEVAIISRFIVSGDEKEFNRLFKVHEDFMRSQGGFVDCYLLRSTSSPERFSHTGWWQSIGSYQDAGERAEYKSQIQGLSTLAEMVDVDVYATAP